MAEGGDVPRGVRPTLNPHNEETPITKTKCLMLFGTGGHREIEVVKKPSPLPRPGEILIEVEACGIGFNDILVRQGFFESLPKFPFILGSECTGKVTATGSADSGFLVDDRVIAVPEFGGWAEVVSVPAEYVFKIPPFMGTRYQESTALFVNYVSAYMMLFDIAELKPRSSVLIHSAAGGLGLALIALCRTVRDITIFATSSVDKHSVLENLVNHVFDYKEDYVTRIKEIVPGGLDLVLECRGGVHFDKAFELLQPLGKCIAYGCAHIVTGERKSCFGAPRDDKQIVVKDLRGNNKSVIGFSLRGLMYRQNDMVRVRKAFDNVCQLMKERRIIPSVDTVFAFEDVDYAMRRIENRLNMGRIVLSPYVNAITREPGRKPLRTRTIEDVRPRGRVPVVVPTTSGESTSGAAAPEVAQPQQSSAQSTAATPAHGLESSVMVPQPGVSQSSEQTSSGQAKAKPGVKFAEAAKATEPAKAKPEVKPVETPKPAEEPATEQAQAILENKPEEAKPEEAPEAESQPSTVTDQPEAKPEQTQADPVEQKVDNESQPNPEEKSKETEGADALHDTPEEQVSEEGAFEESHE